MTRQTPLRSALNTADLSGSIGIADTNFYSWPAFAKSKRVTHKMYGLRVGGYVHYARNNAGLVQMYHPDFTPGDDHVSICVRIEAFDEALGSEQYIGIDKCRPRDMLEHAIDVATGLQLPLIALASPRFARPADYPRILAAQAIEQKDIIGSTTFEPRVGRGNYLLSRAEMFERFSDLLSALDNALALADELQASFTPADPEVPSFTGDNAKDIDRLERLLDLSDERICHEYDVITGMGFAGYFLIVADYVKWAKANGVLVGPGRGSGAGSAIAYALGITDVDPIRYGLLFERFLNPDRVALPDFDIDFDPIGRERVINYCINRYGSSHACRIAAISTIQARSALGYASRILGYGFNYLGHVDISERLGIPPNRCIKQVTHCASEIEGLPLSESDHPAGVVISTNRPITDVCPVRNARTGLDMKGVEAVGLVKFDFLGLQTLSQIAVACELAGGGSPDDIPEEVDAIEAEMLARGAVDGVFQIEEHQAQRLAIDVKPKSVEELSDILALIRPGAAESGMLDFYVMNDGSSHFEGLGLDDILAPTRGQMIYQEQVLQVARRMARLSYAQADLLRRAMGKKIPEEMRAQRKQFIKGCKNNKIDKDVAKRVFKLIDKFSGYGFNKSHSIAYAIISHRCAWLKAHHPLAFYTATLQTASTDDRLMRIIDAARRDGIEMLPPKLGRSGVTFQIEGAAIRCGLSMIKSISAKMAQKLISGEDPNARARDALLDCGAIKGKRPTVDSERRALGFNLMHAPARRGQLFLHDVRFRTSKKGSPFAELIAVDEELHVSRLMLFGQPFEKYGQKLKAGYRISGVEHRDNWVQKIKRVLS